MTGATANPTEQLPAVREDSPLQLRIAGPEGGAAAPDGDRAAIAAVVEGQVVGRASYTRVYGPRAELSLVIDEAHWHLGLPETLLDAISTHAAGFGITTFLMRVSAADVRLLALLRQGFDARGRRESAHVEIEFETTPPSRWATEIVRRFEASAGPCRRTEAAPAASPRRR
jgi:GNAT superfamily N-acetyltransferase